MQLIFKEENIGSKTNIEPLFFYNSSYSNTRVKTIIENMEKLLTPEQNQKIQIKYLDLCYLEFIHSDEDWIYFILKTKNNHVESVIEFSNESSSLEKLIKDLTSENTDKLVSYEIYKLNGLLKNYKPAGPRSHQNQ